MSLIMTTGAVAQLGARLHGMQKVRGSNPLSSTKKGPLFYQRAFLLFDCCFFQSRMHQRRLGFGIDNHFPIKHYLPVSSTSIYFVFAKRKPRPSIFQVEGKLSNQFAERKCNPTPVKAPTRVSIMWVKV